MNRGLFGQNTKPIALAPASTAASASSRRVMPQIFTNIQLTPASSHHNGHQGHEAPSLSLVVHGSDLCVLSDLCVHGGGRGSEQLLELRAWIRGRHEPFAYEKRAIAERAQPFEILRALEPALADGDDFARHPPDQLFGGVHVDLERPEVPVVHADDSRARV